MNKKFFIKKCLLLVFISFITKISLFSKSKTVKVGYFTDLPYFMSCEQDGSHKNGYGYEYLQRIADYTDWQYEYVYGEYSMLYEMLENGEIDLMENIYKTRKISEPFLYPDSRIGKNDFFLYIKEQKDISDIKKYMKGKKIGVSGDHVYELLSEWKLKTGYNFEILKFTDDYIRDSYFNNGKIDAVVEINYLADNEWFAVEHIGECDFFIAVSNKNKELLNELNSAIESLKSLVPDFESKIFDKYYSSSIVSNKLSEDEKNWVLKHPKIICGLMKNSSLSELEEQEFAIGVLPEIITRLFDNLGVDNIIEYKIFNNNRDLRKALQSGEIDIGYPFYSNDFISEEYGYNYVCDIDSIAISAILAPNARIEEANRITVTSNSICSDYVRYEFSNAVIIICESQAECLSLIKRGMADAYIAPRQNAVDFLLKNGSAKKSGLVSVQLWDPVTVSLGVNNENIPLFTLLTRASSLLSPDFIQHAISANSVVSTSYSVKDFVIDNYIFVMILAILFTTILISLIFLIRSQRLKQKQSLILESERNKAELANRSKSNFMFNMSHDIRTPMNAIMGFTELLCQKKWEDKKIEEYLKNMQISTKYLQDLINNVLEIAKIDTGRSILEENLTEAFEFNDRLIVAFKDEIERKNISYTKEINVKHKIVYCDRTKVQQVFMNILSNSVKYTQNGGNIHMTVTELPGRNENECIYKTIVEDNGIGMSKQFLPHAFEEFARERTVTDQKIMGSGLGLGVTRKLVDLLGGTISIESEVGQGTAVTVSIPHKIANEEEIEHFKKTDILSVNSKNIFKGKRILIAEDNELNANIAIEILKNEGFDVEWAKDGEECIEMVSEADSDYYDLILMDIQMPKMDGYKATKIIRVMSDVMKAEIPIIAMTANAFDEDRQNSIMAGMNGHISKPIDLKKLFETLEELLK